ncbi:MAG TPA: ATP-binding protein [Actinobacteria bacterium]|nr:ATP-binding protein [Actinomycetota bacterium]
MVSFITNNLEVVVFFYGLTLVILGITIFAQLRQTEKSEFKLLEILWLLALFGFTHGAHEFLDLFEIIKGEQLTVSILETALTLFSFVFLLIFSYKLINLSVKVSIWLPVLLVSLLLALSVLLGPYSLKTWNIGSRYFLGLPANILVAIGLTLYYFNELKDQSMKHTYKYFFLATGFFGLYAIVEGLVVPRADFFPANVINSDTFFSLFNVPVRVFRAFAAIGITWTIWNIMDVFNLEQEEREKRAEAALLKKDADIHKAYTDVFSAVTQDKLVLLTEEEVEGSLGEPASEVFEIHSLEKLSESRAFLRNKLGHLVTDPEVIDELIHASGEAVANGVKHAGACEVQLYKIGEAVQIRITDRGSGINFRDLPKATLVAGFSTKHSLGLGFSIMLEVCSRVSLSTGAHGTTLILEKRVDECI